MGGSGNDFIRGGKGSDFMWGEEGADAFYFDTRDADYSLDQIYDFSFAEGDTLVFGTNGREWMTVDEASDLEALAAHKDVDYVGDNGAGDLVVKIDDQSIVVYDFYA